MVAPPYCLGTREHSHPKLNGRATDNCFALVGGSKCGRLIDGADVFGMTGFQHVHHKCKPVASTRQTGRLQTAGARLTWKYCITRVYSVCVDRYACISENSCQLAIVCTKPLTCAIYLAVYSGLSYVCIAYVSSIQALFFMLTYLMCISGTHALVGWYVHIVYI